MMCVKIRRAVLWSVILTKLWTCSYIFTAFFRAKRVRKMDLIDRSIEITMGPVCAPVQAGHRRFFKCLKSVFVNKRVSEFITSCISRGRVDSLGGVTGFIAGTIHLFVAYSTSGRIYWRLMRLFLPDIVLNEDVFYAHYLTRTTCKGTQAQLICKRYNVPQILICSVLRFVKVLNLV